MIYPTDHRYAQATKKLLAAALPPTSHHENRIAPTLSPTNSNCRAKSLPKKLHNTSFSLGAAQFTSTDDKTVEIVKKASALIHSVSESSCRPAMNFFGPEKMLANVNR